MVVSSVVTIGVDEVSNIDSIVDSSVVTIGVDEVSNIDSKVVKGSVVTLIFDSFVVITSVVISVEVINSLPFVITLFVALLTACVMQITFWAKSHPVIR
ncbi:hypothetical protein BpHYR1_009768 [Brachionus plicatilis]|uniref:Uncharacterized protein n=1 Tax=Brachionus plicatilis TaxID=10195 RepID=A0A3M7TAA3_BRAPC|nr:hypothetical protein BpHYR1_009768 [Brachionus plicatilis]